MWFSMFSSVTGGLIGFAAFLVLCHIGDLKNYNMKLSINAGKPVTYGSLWFAFIMLVVALIIPSKF